MLRQADNERGGRLGIPSNDLKSLASKTSRGWAIEARVDAEVPLRNFAPAPGVLQYVRWPERASIRVDTWVSSGQTITPSYDPLVAKIMVHSLQGRSTAQALMLTALADTALQGTQTNMEYLAKVMRSSMFSGGGTAPYSGGSAAAIVFQAGCRQRPSFEAWASGRRWHPRPSRGQRRLSTSAPISRFEIDRPRAGHRWRPGKEAAGR